jgi:hypothetical protein
VPLIPSCEPWWGWAIGLPWIASYLTPSSKPSPTATRSFWAYSRRSRSGVFRARQPRGFSNRRSSCWVETARQSSRAPARVRSPARVAPTVGRVGGAGCHPLYADAATTEVGRGAHGVLRPPSATDSRVVALLISLCADVMPTPARTSRLRSRSARGVPRVRNPSLTSVGAETRSSHTYAMGHTGRRHTPPLRYRGAYAISDSESRFKRMPEPNSG